MVMWYVYAICAAIGATILVCQFVMTLTGLGGEHGDFGGGDGHFELGHDGAGHTGHDAHADDGHSHDQHVGSNWLFGVITFRTILAALAFFGLAGLAGVTSELGPLPTFVAAAAAGVAAMYGVHALMQGLHRLNEDPTARIQSSVGRTGSVYLRVPGGRAGSGKVTVIVQGQSLEVLAMTPHEAIPTGARVRVVGVLDRETVEVEPLRETAQA
jgi:membrane protein implicated in regulation of membrane protease activity